MSSSKLSITNSNHFANVGLGRPYYFKICASLLADQALMCVSQNQKKHTTLKTDDCYWSCLASLSLNLKKRAKRVCILLPNQTACWHSGIGLSWLRLL